MFKRFIVRSLIITQVYGNLFQGVLHADITQGYLVRDEIYLHSSAGRDGGLRLALGTNAASGSDLEVLKLLEIPSYNTLKRVEPWPTIPLPTSANPLDTYHDEPIEAADSVFAPLAIVDSLDDSLKSLSSLGLEAIDVRAVDQPSASSAAPTSPTSPTSLALSSVLEEEDSAIGFTKDGITRIPDGVYFTLQGLHISIKDDGNILVRGTQTDRRPVFLSCERAVTLDNVQANTLQITAPGFFNTGETRIDSLTLEGLGSDSAFINTGRLNAQELFLKNLNSGNTGTIAAPRFSVEGDLESTGSIESDELILEEGAFLNLTEGSGASIKTLFLSQNSRAENHITDEMSIDVLDGLGGTLTNLGSLTVGGVAADSGFQSILNRNLMAVMTGTVHTHHFENNGTWAAQSPLVLHQGQNTGTLISSDLQVGASFTNAERGVVITPVVSGSGALENLGRFGHADHLAIGIREFTNGGKLEAKSINGSVILEKFVNADQKTIVVTEDLRFTDATQFTNDGTLIARHMHLVGEKTTQRGLLSGKSLEVSGSGEFVNQGEIAVTDAVSLSVPRVINLGSIELQGGSLKTLAPTTMVNSGSITGGAYEFAGKLIQEGTLEGNRLAISGRYEFENLGKIAISGLVSLDTSRFVNTGSIKAGSIAGSLELTYLENARRASIELQGGEFKVLRRTGFVNDGSITGGAYDFAGPNLVQHGILKGRSLKTGIDTVLITDDNNQELEIDGAIETFFSDPWEIRGKVKASKFIHIGTIDLLGTLAIAGDFEGAGTIQPSGELHARAIEFSDQMTVLGSVKAERLTAARKLIVNGNGKVSVKNQATLYGDVCVGVGGKFIGIKGHELTLDSEGTVENSGLIAADTFNATRAISVNNTGKIVAKKLTAQDSVVNDGTITGGAYEFNGPSVTQRGILRGPSLKVGRDTIITTTDGQEMSITEAINTFFTALWTVRGTVETARFSHAGILDLVGSLTIADDFKGRGTIQPLGKLHARTIEFLDQMTVLGGVKAERLTAARKLIVNGNGKVSVKNQATINGDLVVGAQGVVEGIQGHALSLDLRGRADIAGRVDVDQLSSARAIAVTQNGQVLTQKSTTLTEGLTIAPGATAQLKGLKVDGGAITNAGKLTVVGVEKGRVEINIANEGTTSIDGLYPVPIVLGVMPAPIDTLKMCLLNKPGGQLTLKGGKFDLTGNSAFLNQGVLIQDTAQVQWSTPSAGQQAINTGEWHILSSGARLLNYTGEAMGKVYINGVLTVECLVDALQALDGLTEVKALNNTKVEVHAPVLQNPNLPLKRKKSYAWPLKMVIAGAIDNHIDIRALQLAIESRGGLKTSGFLFSDEGVLDLDIKGDLEVSSKIGGQAGVRLHSKKLAVLGRQNIVGAAYPNILYRRSGNGIYSQGPVEINVDEVIDNSFGVIHGQSFAIVAPSLINRAGMIRAMDPRLSSSIRANIKNSREEKGAHTIRVNGWYEAGGKMWCPHGSRHCGCDGMKNVNYTYETSGEGLIAAQGILQLTYNYLDMLASRIVCGGDLTLISGGRMQTHSRKGAVADFLGTTTAVARNGHSNYVLVKEHLEADLGDVDMTCAFTARDISIRAAQAVFRNLGVQQGGRGALVNLSALMRGPNAENVYEEVDGVVRLELPFRNLSMPGAVVVLGKDANKKSRDAASIDVQATFGALHHAMGSEFFTLYRGVSALGMKMEDIAASFAEMVRGHKYTQSHRRTITAGDATQEVEVLSNEVITPQYLMESGIVGVFLDFTRNIHRLEDKQQAQIDAREIEREAAGMFTASTQLVVPDTAKHDGFRAIGGGVSVVTEGDNSVFTNVRAKTIELASTRGAMTFGSSLVRHGDGENYYDELVQSTAEADEAINIQGHTQVSLPAAKTKSRGRTDIVAVEGPVIEEALAAVSQRVDRHSTKKATTTTTTIDIHHHVASHESLDSIVNIHGATGIYQQGTTLVNAVLMAPVIEQPTVQDRHIVQSETVSHKKTWFGAARRKTEASSSVASIAKGCAMGGESFIALAAERYRAVAPTYTATRSDITAPKVEMATGVNHSQSHAQSTSHGSIWTKTKVSTEKHTTHVNPRFERNVYIHSPEVIIERVRGSADFAHVISDSPIAYVDRVDHHEATSKTQKNLSAGMQLLVKLTAGLGIALATGGTGIAGAFELVGTQAAMVNAGFVALCGDAAVNLVEQGGDPARAIKAMGKNGTALNIAKAMATAGLTDKIGRMAGIKSGLDLDAAGKVIPHEFTDYAAKAAINAAVHTVLSVAIDKQDFKQAMLQGMSSAAVNTVASYGAGQIGGLYSKEAVNYGVHKALHGLTGAGLGAGLAVISHTDPRLGAASGAFGAVMAEMIAEGFKPEMADVEQYRHDHPGEDSKVIQDHFIAQAQNTSNWSAFASAVGAFGIGMDPQTSNTSARNALDHNFDPTTTIAIALMVGIMSASPQYWRDLETDEPHVALKKLGINTAKDSIIALAAGCAFEVAGVACKTMSEAVAVVVARNPMLKSVCAGLESRFARIEAYVRDQFNYREHFAAERLRLEGGKASTKFGRYAEAEDIVKAHGCSRQYVGDTHVYVVRNKETGQIYKIGESMQGVNRLGLSKRAEAQARKLFKETGQEHTTEIREIFGTKDFARSAETATIERYRSMFGKDLLPGNKGNR